MTEDAALSLCNKTELLQIARQQGLGIISRAIPTEELISVISGCSFLDPKYLATSIYTRTKLEEFIQMNIEKIRNQLPGCDGHCTTYPCSDGRHGLCYLPNAEIAQ